VGGGIFDQIVSASGVLAIAAAPASVGLSLVVGAAGQLLGMLKSTVCDLNEEEELLKKIDYMIDKKIEQAQLDFVKSNLLTLANFMKQETSWSLQDARVGYIHAKSAVTAANAMGMPGLNVLLVCFQELFYFLELIIEKLYKTREDSNTQMEEYIEAKGKLVIQVHFLAESLTAIQTEFIKYFTHGKAKLTLYHYHTTCGGYFYIKGKKEEVECKFCKQSHCTMAQKKITSKHHKHITEAQAALFSQDVKKITSALFMLSGKTVIEFNYRKNGVLYIDYYIKENWNGCPWHNIQKTANFYMNNGKWGYFRADTGKREIELTTNNNNILNSKFDSGFFSQPSYVPTLTFSGIPQDHGDFNGVYERSTEKRNDFNIWYNKDKTAYFYASHITSATLHVIGWYLVRNRDQRVLVQSIKVGHNRGYDHQLDDLIAAHFDEVESHPW